jgi:anti-sigma factor RsiW
MSDDRHDHDELEAYVLDALDAREREAFEAHLSVCTTCAHEGAAYTHTLQSLANTYVPAPPPVPFVNGRAFARNRRRARAVIIAAAVAALAIGLAAPRIVRYERTERDYAAIALMLANQPRQIALIGHHSGVSGRAIVGDGRRRSGFLATGLPMPQAGMVYRVYVRNAAGRHSLGALEPTSDGLLVLVTPGDALAAAASVRVVLEREHDPDTSPRTEVLVGILG